ncbi:uncharacterized protein LOC121385405 [Gigantopelta aegis]|uniref:uncharacterized protein LOC121385405 n=1 Tax=Gigantopelta aegis TaxID=1735272 RepID=UPI001B88E2D9|nr:uncharacterized protein LOC121385405 [Gigantopelta aegis]
MILKLSSFVRKASLAYLTFVSVWCLICCTNPVLGAGANLEGGQPNGFKRAAFSAWAGKRNSEKIAPYFSESDKRAAFSSWAGKRDSWQGSPTDDDGDDVVGEIYGAVEPNVNDANGVTPHDKRDPFSSWAGKRAAFSSWAGKRGSALHNQLELINHLLEQIVARVMRKRMFNAWAGKRDQDGDSGASHELTRRKFSAWHGK